MAKSNKNAIFHEACFGNDIKLVTKYKTSWVIEHISLTHEQIDNDFRDVIMLGFRDEIAYKLLLSPQYFIDNTILKSNLNSLATIVFCVA